MEGISKGMQSKDSRGFLTQGRDKAIPTQNSGAQMNARKHQLRSRNSKIWCEWSRGSDVMTEGSRRAGHTKPRSRAEERGCAGFGDTGELTTSFQQESARSLRWDWNRGRDGEEAMPPTGVPVRNTKDLAQGCEWGRKCPWETQGEMSVTTSAIHTSPVLTELTRTFKWEYLDVPGSETLNNHCLTRPCNVRCWINVSKGPELHKQNGGQVVLR